MKSVMIVFLLFFVAVGVIYAKPHRSSAMEKGYGERKNEKVVIQRQHASSNMTGENAGILLRNDDEEDEENAEEEDEENAEEEDEENAGEGDEENVDETEELREADYGHCLRKTYKEYPCDHGHRVGCLRYGIYKGYCWRSCTNLNGAYVGFEYPRDKAWNYLRCSNPTKGRKADMECIKKGAGTGHGGKTCY